MTDNPMTAPPKLEPFKDKHAEAWKRYNRKRIATIIIAPPVLLIGQWWLSNGNDGTPFINILILSLIVPVLVGGLALLQSNLWSWGTRGWPKHDE